MLAIAHDGSATTDEFRDALGITESFVRVASAFQTSAAATVAGREQHGDGGAEVLATAAGLSRPEAHSRTFVQCMADALDSLTAGNAAGDGKGKPIADICVVAHVDDETGNLIAELPDGDRLPPAVLEEFACNAKFTGVVYGRRGKPIWRAESCRTATEAQRQILIARYGGCFHCAAHPALCQVHHIRPVSQGGSTRLDNMVPVCWACHHRIHHHKWRIRTTNGQHTLHPPGRAHHGPAWAPEQPILYLSGTDAPPEPHHAENRAPCATIWDMAQI